MTRTVMVLGGSAWQLDLIRKIGQLGYQTLVADVSPDAPGRHLADQFVSVDTNDREQLVELARENRVEHVLSDQSDRVVATVGYLNTALGLRGIDEPTALRFTNKLLMRNGLAGSGVAMPAYAEIASIEEGLDWAGQQGFPVVLKPKQSWASMGVKKVDNSEQLRREFPISLQESRDGKLLVEEFIDGTEVTVEGFSVGGHYTPLAISEKEHYVDAACVARRLAYPPRMPAAAIERIGDSARRCVNGLGLQDGISHAEFKLHAGVPHLMEVAARGGGNRISSLIVPYICGFDLYEPLLGRLRGEEVVLPESLQRAAILQFFNFRPGRIKSIHGLDEVRREGLAYQLELPIAAGDTIGTPDSDRERVGFFIALGETRDEVDAKAARIEHLVRLEYQGHSRPEPAAKVCA